MGCIHRQEINTAASWRATDLSCEQSWLVHFTNAEIAALDQAVAAVMGAPLSQVEIEAFDIIGSITHDPAMRLDMMLEPGDIQLANNYAVMHSRTSFTDDDDPARHRKKLRLRLKMDNTRRLAPDFSGCDGVS